MNQLIVVIISWFISLIVYLKRYGNTNITMRYEVLRQLGMLNFKNLFSVQPIKILSTKYAQNPETKPETKPHNIIDEIEKFGHKVFVFEVVLSLNSTHHGRYAIRCIHCKQFIFLDFGNDRAKKARKFLEVKAGSAIYFKDWPIEDFPYKFLRKNKIVMGDMLTYFYCSHLQHQNVKADEILTEEILEK